MVEAFKLLWGWNLAADLLFAAWVVWMLPVGAMPRALVAVVLLSWAVRSRAVDTRLDMMGDRLDVHGRHFGVLTERLEVEGQRLEAIERRELNAVWVRVVVDKRP